METWEVVLILALLTISIIVITKHKVPTEIITILDSPIFQIVLLGLTLVAAVTSPAVAIVAVTTLVVVYYMRNVVKIQIVSANVKTMPHGAQVAVIEEKRVTTIINNHEHNIMPVPKQDPNAETIEQALKESEMRPPNYNHQVIGNKMPVNGSLQFPAEKARSYEIFADPRGKSTSVESFDTEAKFNYNVPSSAVDRTIVPEVDSEVFKRGPQNPDASNEDTTISNQMRGFNSNDGQYEINEPRPSSLPGKYEVSTYNPDEFIGSNKFIPVGVSVDDKIKNLSNGKFVSGAPPPNFDLPVPSKMY